MEQLPVILEYFIPGFIFVSTFQVLTSRKSSSHQLIISVVASYIIKALCSVGHNYIFTTISFSWQWRVIILSLMAVILSLVLVFVTEIKCVNQLLMQINNKSIHDDIWRDVIDYRNSTTLRIICGSMTYTGILVMHEEKGSDSWFVLEDFIVEGNGENYKAEDMDFRARIAINLKNADRVELYYGK